MGRKRKEEEVVEEEVVDAAETADVESVEEEVVDESVKATSVDAGHFRVFYKELTASGRNGATAHKVFTNRKEADEFASEVGGRVV